MKLDDSFWSFYSYCYDAICSLVPYQDMMKDIVAAMQLNPGMKILDAGCGTGNLEREIFSQGVPVKITALDFSDSMLLRAQKKNLHGVKFLKLDLGKKLPFDDCEFDIVVSNNVIYALSNAQPTLAEFRRVTKPDGKILISDPKPSFKNSKIMEAHLCKNNKNHALAVCKMLSSPLWLSRMFIVAVINSAIDKSEAEGNYCYRTVDGWRELLGSELVINSTYADQNWFIVVQNDKEDGDVRIS